MRRLIVATATLLGCSSVRMVKEPLEQARTSESAEAVRAEESAPLPAPEPVPDAAFEAGPPAASGAPHASHPSGTAPAPQPVPREPSSARGPVVDIDLQGSHFQVSCPEAGPCPPAPELKCEPKVVEKLVEVSQDLTMEVVRPALAAVGAAMAIEVTRRLRRKKKS